MSAQTSACHDRSWVAASPQLAQRVWKVTPDFGVRFGFGAGVEGAVLGAELLGRVAGHPESFFVSHTYLSFCGTTVKRVERVRE